MLKRCLPLSGSGHSLEWRTLQILPVQLLAAYRPYFSQHMSVTSSHPASQAAPKFWRTHTPSILQLTIPTARGHHCGLGQRARNYYKNPIPKTM